MGKRQIVDYGSGDCPDYRYATADGGEPVPLDDIFGASDLGLRLEFAPPPQDAGNIAKWDTDALNKRRAAGEELPMDQRVANLRRYYHKKYGKEIGEEHVAAQAMRLWGVDTSADSPAEAA